MDNIIPTFKYLFLTIKHKYFVFQAGLKLECSIWRLIKHDWTKFLLSELPHYGRQFFGTKDDEYGFNKAWLHHQNSNDHHWEWWINRTFHCRSNSKDIKMLEMSEGAIQEMIADWLGASRAYGGKWPKNIKDWVWFKDHFNKLPLLSSTRRSVLFYLRRYFYKQTREIIEWDGK